MANTVPHLFFTVLLIFSVKAPLCNIFESLRLQNTLIHGKLKLLNSCFNSINQTFKCIHTLHHYTCSPFVSVVACLLLMHGCKRRDTKRIWQRSFTCELPYLLANNTHVSVAQILWNCSFCLAQSVETAASTPSERKQYSTVSKLQGIQCGSASGLTPSFLFLLLL